MSNALSFTYALRHLSGKNSSILMQSSASKAVKKATTEVRTLAKQEVVIFTVTSFMVLHSKGPVAVRLQFPSLVGPTAWSPVQPVDNIMVLPFACVVEITNSQENANFDGSLDVAVAYD